MTIPSDVRQRVAEKLNLIEEGKFDQDDVELILIRLRDYSPNGLFREIADFVGHHNRKKGLTYSLHYSFYCVMKAFMKYRTNSLPIDVSKPLERWELDFINYQLQNIPKIRTWFYLGISPKAAIDKVDKHIEYDKEIQKYVIKEDKQKDLNQILKLAFSIILKPRPLCKAEEIVDNFVHVISDLGFSINKSRIEDHKELLLLSIMVLMNNRNFMYDNNALGRSHMIMRKSKEGGFENLVLEGVVSMPQGPNFIIPIIESSISRGNLVSEELFITDENAKDGELTDKFDYQSNFTIKSEEGVFKLCRLE